MQGPAILVPLLFRVQPASYCLSTRRKPALAAGMVTVVVVVVPPEGMPETLVAQLPEVTEDFVSTE